jgi:hypothetical protein
VDLAVDDDDDEAEEDGAGRGDGLSMTEVLDSDSPSPDDPGTNADGGDTAAGAFGACHPGPDPWGGDTGATVPSAWVRGGNSRFMGVRRRCEVVEDTCLWDS